MGFDTSGVIVSYFGSLDLWTVSMNLITILGLNPWFLAIHLLVTQQAICYSKWGCIPTSVFLTFLEMCWDDYVGGLKHRLVHDICKSISAIKQEYTTARGANISHTPDKLYTKYISAVTGLLDNASLWLVTLCSAYFSALSSRIATNNWHRTTFGTCPLFVFLC